MANGVLWSRLSVIKHVDEVNYGQSKPKRIRMILWKQSLPVIEMKSFGKSFVSPLLLSPVQKPNLIN